MGKLADTFALCMALLCVLFSQPDLTAEVVVFPDPDLEAAVRNRINKPTGDILDTDLVGVGFTWLEAGNGFPISDLTGLEHCTDLTQLSINDTHVLADLTPLADLAGLTNLSLCGNQISDLAPLAGLSELEHLRLVANLISDLTPLAGLTGLSSLDLEQNQVSDLTPLAGLTGLPFLNLNHNEITDLTPLAGLTGLTWLELFDNRIVHLAPLAGLTGLESLDLSRNLITDLGPLAGLTNLGLLSVGQNQISDLTPLAALTNLGILTASQNQIADLTPLAAFANLGWLYLPHNQISNLAPLAGLTHLEHLELSYNQIQDLTPLTWLTCLDFLLLDCNRITDISGLVANLAMTGADCLILWGNPLSQRALCEQVPQLCARGLDPQCGQVCGGEGESEGEGEGEESRRMMLESIGAAGSSVAADRGASLGPLLGLNEQDWTNYGAWDIEGVEAGPPGPFGDGIPDLFQLALFAESYCNDQHWLHDETVAAYETNLTAIFSDIAMQEYPQAHCNIWAWIATSVSLSSRMRETVCALFGLNADNYVVVTLPGKTVNEPFSAEGDCDGDSVSNIDEYEHVVSCGGDMEAFVIAASENSPFWEGNPAVPLAGIIGLLLLCVGIAAAYMSARGATGA